MKHLNVLKKKKIYLYIGCSESSLLCTGLFYSCRVGATLRCGMKASLVMEPGSRQAGSAVAVRGLSCSAAWGSSRTRDRIQVPCTGRWILGHWTTREVLYAILKCLADNVDRFGNAHACIRTL